MPTGINTQEDEQQDGKAPQRGATIAEERQGNTDHRRQSQHHTHVDKHMEKEDAQYRVAIYPSETVWLSFSQVYQSQD